MRHVHSTPGLHGVLTPSRTLWLILGGRLCMRAPLPLAMRVARGHVCPGPGMWVPIAWAYPLVGTMQLRRMQCFVDRERRKPLHWRVSGCWHSACVGAAPLLGCNLPGCESMLESWGAPVGVQGCRARAAPLMGCAIALHACAWCWACRHVHATGREARGWGGEWSTLSCFPRLGLGITSYERPNLGVSDAL